MKTKISVWVFLAIPLAGTVRCSVRPPRAQPLAGSAQQAARRSSLSASLKEFGKFFRAGDFDQAAVLAGQGYHDALEAGERRLAAQFLSNLGGCRFAEHRYQEALQTYLDARSLADAAGDRQIAGALDFNISSLYLQLGQLDAAADSAERAMARLSGEERAKHLPKLLIHLATVRALQERMPEARELFQEGIAAADRANDPEMYALGWNDLGEEYLKRKDLRPAELALLEAYRIRKLYRLRSIESSYRNLGRLRLEQGDLGAASGLLDEAVACSRQPGGLLPGWQVYDARGRVRLAQNRLTDALEDLRVAARLARIWRRAAPLDDATRVSAENSVQSVHSALVEAGNKRYFATHDRSLARETFEAAEANRAADLEMPDLARRTQQSLGDEAAFLSFHLASPDSYLWAVSRHEFALYRLPAAPEIAALASRFEKAVQTHSPDAAPAGAQLYRMLFGQVPPAIQRKAHWLLALDSQLFELPFAALVAEARPAGPIFLVERHSLQITSGAGLLVLAAGAPRHTLSGPFLAVADPVYNTADPRWRGAPRPPNRNRTASFLDLFSVGAGAKPAEDLHLARLPGTAREAAVCAAAWGGPLPATLLEGPAASRQRVQAALDAHPAVLHFATHVLQSRDRFRSGLIVPSLTGGGQNEVLSSKEIGAWHLEGTLVSLSGCSSGTADALPGTGLTGLTRAWQAAGAGAVVASRWPSPDDAGSLFSAFYGHLRAGLQAGAAVALANAQRDLLRSHTWRSSPSYWGAYFVTGNQQR